LEAASQTPARRHRHKLIVAGLAVVASALAFQFAADPTETTAASQLPQPQLASPDVSSIPLPTAADASVTVLEPAVLPTEEHAQPDASLVEAPQPEAPSTHWTEHRIKSGDTLAQVFHDQGLSAQTLYKLTNSSEQAASLARIVPGQQLRFELDEAGGLVSLEHVLSPIRKLRITASDEGYVSEEVVKDIEVRHAEAFGTIQDSLFVDGQNAGLSDGQIMELAGIFGWDIDFALELRRGDSFSLVYEEHYLDGKKFRNGPILAAEFINRGTTYRALRYEDKDGYASYFDEDGRSKRRAFIRSPVKFARVSSGFTNKRWHPVLKKWRSHKGTDYAAPTGTPIRATGGGTVTFRGWKGGYGRVVIIQHANKYTTVYAHMSRFRKDVKKGSKVKQGQTIGYVGSSGLASGPHLHYEFRVNGVHRNPLTVKLPKSAPLPKGELAEFQQSTAPLLARLENLAPPTLVAANTADGQ
jgi:murein DD-endopeptidase MepM/ murein hydrolase activator NlpD